MDQDLPKLVLFIKHLANGTTTPFSRWLSFIACIIISIIVAKIAEFIIRHLLKVLVRKTRTSLDDQILQSLHKPIIFALTVSGIYGSCFFLYLKYGINVFLFRIYLALMIANALNMLLRINRICCRALAKKVDAKGSTYSALLADLLQPLIKVILWIIAILLLFDKVFGVNIAALLAGAGIAAMAIAFAAQNTIANIFGAISLIIDRPFRIGDRIQIGDKDGVVEAIGLRSTSLRAMDGTVWSIPNRTMTDTPIHNYSERPFFKETFTVNLTYDCSIADLRRGKDILHAILDRHELFDMEKQPPVITFQELGNYSLDLQAICWFQTTDFATFRKAKEEINLKILDEFAKANLEIAFPSQTIYLKNSDQ